MNPCLSFLLVVLLIFYFDTSLYILQNVRGRIEEIRISRTETRK